MHSEHYKKHSVHLTSRNACHMIFIHGKALAAEHYTIDLMVLSLICGCNALLPGLSPIQSAVREASLWWSFVWWDSVERMQNLEPNRYYTSRIRYSAHDCDGSQSCCSVAHLITSVCKDSKGHNRLRESFAGHQQKDGMKQLRHGIGTHYCIHGDQKSATGSHRHQQTNRGRRRKLDQEFAAFQRNSWKKKLPTFCWQSSSSSLLLQFMRRRPSAQKVMTEVVPTGSLCTYM